MPELPSEIQPIIHALSHGDAAAKRLGLRLPNGYVPEKQLLSQWCWAAVTTFVARIWLGRRIQQCEVARACAEVWGVFPDDVTFCPEAGQLPPSVLNQPLPVQQPLACLFSEPRGSLPGYVEIPHYRMGSVRQAILGILGGTQPAPIPLHVEWNSGGTGHFICIYAMVRSGSKWDFVVFDPFQQYDAGDDDEAYLIPESRLDAFKGIDSLGGVSEGRPTYFIQLERP